VDAQQSRPRHGYHLDRFRQSVGQFKGEGVLELHFALREEKGREHLVESSTGRRWGRIYDCIIHQSSVEAKKEQKIGGEGKGKQS